MYKCIGRVKDERGTITEYILKKEYSFEKPISVEPSNLKKYMLMGNEVSNLKLTKNNRIVLSGDEAKSITQIVSSHKGKSSIEDSLGIVVTYNIQYMDSIETYEELYRQAESKDITLEIRDALIKIGGFWVNADGKQESKKGTLREAIENLKDTIYSEYGKDVSIKIEKMQNISIYIKEAEGIINKALEGKRHVIKAIVNTNNKLNQTYYWRIAF